MNQRTTIVAIAVMAIGMVYTVPTGAYGVSSQENKKVPDQAFLITNTLVTARDIRVLLTQSAGAQSPEAVTWSDSRKACENRGFADQNLHHELRPP